MAKFKVAFLTKTRSLLGCGWGGCGITLDMPANTKVKKFFENKIEEYNAMYADGKGTAGPDYKSKIDANQKATKVVFNYEFLKSLGFDGPFTNKKLTVDLTNETTLEDLLYSQKYGNRVLTPKDLTEKQPCFRVYFE